MSRNPSSAEPPPPPVYNGRYELSQQIARGGTAQVYRARDLLLDRPVALKVLFPELSSDSSFVERFRREAQAAANLSHPNIVPVFDWGESDRTYFIVMEYVDGEPLSAIIRRSAPLPPVRAAAIAGDIAKALSYAHRRGVVHRDVKPGNVLITRDGLVKVADFGIARAVGADDNVTQTGLVMGTATYFSPEQAQGLGVDGRSDVYSLGVVLYEMVTGKTPFHADTPVAIAYKHVSEAPVPPRQIEPSVPEALEAVILQAMAKNPADRYATAEDLHADLARFVQGTPVHALSPAFVGGSAPGAAATQALSYSPTSVLPSAGGAIGLGAAGTATALQQRTEVAGGPPGGQPPMPKRRWIPWAIAGVLLLVALGLLIYYGGRQLGYFGATGYVKVPGVIGYQLNDAKSTLSAEGLKVRAVPEHSSKTKGLVLTESPDAGTQVRPHSIVTLYYSAGLQPIAVPQEIGQNYLKAEADLTTKGFRVKLVKVAAGPGQTIGQVENQSPSYGTMRPPGSFVTLYYYENPTVPNNLIGKSLNYVTGKLQAAHLTVGTVTHQISSTIANGNVISTNPAPGSPVSPGQSVDIVVSEGAGVTVPDVKGDPVAQAKQTLSNAGLAVSVVTQNGPAAQENLVIDQSPPGNTQAPKGATVTITVDIGDIKLSPTQLPHAHLAQPYTEQLSASGGSGGYSFSWSGSTPPGLTLSPQGQITGAPTQTGSYSFTVTATDSDQNTGTQSYTLVVKKKPGATGPTGPAPGGAKRAGRTSGARFVAARREPSPLPPTRRS